MSKLEINVTTNIDAEELARFANRDELVQFVIDLDLAIGEWDFTLPLIKHFEDLHAKYHLECKEDSITCDVCGVTP